jgi:hypothetical protein
MADARPRVLVLAPEAEAGLLAALLDESGYLPTLVRTPTEATNVLGAAAPTAMLVWVRPADAESLTTLRAMASRAGDVPVLAVVDGEGAAARGMLGQLGARATLLLVPDANRESLEPLRQVLDVASREAKRRRLGHAIP